MTNHTKLVKTLPTLVVASMLATTLVCNGETILFDDTFGSSTLNNATPADPDTNSTAYQMLSGKSWSGQSIAANQLRVGMVATGSGIMECQTLFATNPVTLDAINDSIELRITFTNTAGLLTSSSTTLGFGLFNSGGTEGSVKPVPGGLNATMDKSKTGYGTGYAQGWMGYFGSVGGSGGSHKIFNRNAQGTPITGTSDNNQQGTATSGTGGSPANPAPIQIGDSAASTLSLDVGGTYTEVLSITRNGDSSLAITNILYSGPEPGGAPVATVGGIATNSTYLTGAFDSLSIAWRAAAATTMDVSRITVTKYTQADLPALYNVQLNGFTANTFSGAARIGSDGDLWNNPDWAGVSTGSTNLFTDVPVLTSGSTDLGVTATMTAAYNDNTTAWNDGGVFNHYSGQTAGSATPILMDQEVKVDYSQTVKAVNVMTITFSGLPANKPVTAYVYGAGNGAGQGGQWSFDAANGGASAVIGYDGSATGRDVTLNSSKGISWESLAGTIDASGKLTITATGTHANSVWYQTYMNGLQLQVGGTAPTIIGLTDQSVEDGTTVVLSPVVTGNPVPTYQWYENGTNMPDETNSVLTLPSVTTGQNGYVYSLVAENAIGIVSNSMTLTVNASVYSDMSVTAMSPANAAQGICYDTPLTVTFSDAVSLGTVGSIKIFNATNSATPVDTINAADGLVQQRTFPGDGQSFSYQTIQITGNTVTIYPHFNALTSNQTYYVTIDPKTFLDSKGVNFVGLMDTNAWQFATKDGPADAGNLMVNQDGSGDFLTVQGAVDSIAAGSSATQRVINIKNGLYNEIVDIAGRNNVTFRGESRAGAVIAFPNNAVFQAANGGTTHARMNFKVNANDVVIESLTVSNSTPQGGGQAEALMIESGAARCIVNNAELDSRQDTILANVNTSQCYFYRSIIKGNFDYIWGGGNLYFDQCEIRTISGSSSFNLTAARTTTASAQSSNYPWLNPGGTYTANGMSFVNCTFTADSGVGSVTLAGSNGTAANNVSWYGCNFAANYVAPSVLFSGNYLFWQAENTQSGAPVTFANVTMISGSDPELLAATNIPTWFYGWQPQLAPNILTNPVGQKIFTGSPATFTVVATGIPDPTYQWLKNGTNVVDETNAVLTIASATTDDAGDYSVIVSTSAGDVTSSIATLTVTPTPPSPTVTEPTTVAGGQFSLTINGQTGLNYSVQVSTNLVSTNWVTIFTTNSPALPFIFTDTNTLMPEQFYRIMVGP